MPDSIRIKEIHEILTQYNMKDIYLSLNADKFSKDETSSDPENTPRVANLGYYIERIARVLGISVNPNGSVRSIRQKKEILKGESIPPGWNFGQFGVNKGGQPANGGQPGGNNEEFRDGIIYEQRSNYFFPDIFNPEQLTVKQGNYTLCENLPQLLDEILDDLDKGLGWQELGANIIPNADGSGKYFRYEGLAQLQTEIAFIASRLSQHTAQIQVATLICQGVAYELLKATGQPLIPKSVEVNLGGVGNAQVPYTGLASDAPSQLEQTSWILQNLAPILASIVKMKPEENPPIPESPPQPENQESK